MMVMRSLGLAVISTVCIGLVAVLGQSANATPNPLK